ncbi:hypothetical protein [Lentilactobacillus otakiensis]|uniref:hypothetical protein n=1 Tax=Lentilactobacillus otakiensis TaxID=481720 RepID=UPI003D17B813
MIVKQPKLIKITYFCVTVLAIIATGWLLAGTVTGYYKFPYDTFHANTNQLIGAIFGSLIFLMLLWYSAKWFATRFTGWLLLFLSVMSIPKIIMIYSFRLNLISDMWSYNVLGGSRANGDSWQWLYHVRALDLDSIFPHVIHIGNFYHYLYKVVVNSPKVVQWFNIGISVLSAILILNIVSYFFNRQTGMFAALTFFFLPTWYIYTTLLGAEPVWLFALLMSMSLLNRLVTYRSLKDRHFWLDAGWIVVALYFAQNIRPLSMVIVIAYGLFVWFKFKEPLKRHEHPKAVWVPRIGILAVVLVFFGLTQIEPKVDQFVYGVPIAKSSIGQEYTLATGTTIKTGGMWSSKLVKKLEKYNHDQTLTPAQKFAGFDQVLKKQLKANTEALTRNGKWKDFLFRKNEILMQPDYGPVLFWNNTRKPNYMWEDLTPFEIGTLTNLVTGFQIAFLILTMIGMLPQLVPRIDDLSGIHEKNGILVNEIVMIGMTLIFMAVEVQSRYQVAFYIPWMMISSLGMSYVVPNFSLKEKPSHSEIPVSVKN